MNDAIPTLTALSCEVLRPGAPPVRLDLEAAEVRLGSGRHCDIRLPSEEAYGEDVVVRRSPSGLIAQALHPRPEVTLDGAVLTHGAIRCGASLAVGSTRVRFRLTGGPPARTKRPTWSDLPLLGAALAVVLAAAALMLGRAPVEPSIPPELPLLWDAPTSACGERGADALERARELLAMAESKRERRPFRVADGVAAVPLYDGAAACFDAGGDGSSAQLAREGSRRMRGDAERALRTHRLRLERALRLGDLALARRETRVLLDLCAGRDGPFVEHLRTLDHTLRQQVGREGSS